MKKTDQATVDAIRTQLSQNPELTYKEMANSFGVSEVTVKRLCSGLGRGKDWRLGKNKPSADHQKFWAKVQRSAKCWEWAGSKNNSGYGFLYFNGASQAAHRVAYTLLKGPIPDDLELDHLCRNRVCCNPEHLQPVTREENMKRMRSLRSCPEPAHSQAVTLPEAQSLYAPVLYQGGGPSADQDQLYGGPPVNRRPYRYAPPNAIAMMTVGERNWLALQNVRWRLTSEQLVADGYQLPVFLFTHAEYGISVYLPARSMEFAKEMFTCVWNSHYDAEVLDTGEVKILNHHSAQIYDWTWRSDLEEACLKWELTDIGIRHRVRPRPHYLYCAETGPVRMTAADRKQRSAEDLRWGLTREKLIELGSALTSYLIENEDDGIFVRVDARTGEFAKEMFESIWGPHFDVTVCKAGGTKLHEENAEAYQWEWRAELERRNHDWIRTQKGKRCRERMCEEGQQRNRDQYMERELERIDDDEEFFRAEEQKAEERKKRAAQKKVAAGNVCPRCRQRVVRGRTKQSYGHFSGSDESCHQRESYPDEECDRREAYPDEGYGSGSYPDED